MSKKEDKDMLKEKYVEFSKKHIENLKKNKVPVKIKDGEMLIDKKHPDYKYWVED